jgi:hypothetical protein
VRRTEEEFSHTRTAATRTPPRGGRVNKLARARSGLSRVNLLSLSGSLLLIILLFRLPRAKEDDGTWRQRTEIPVVVRQREERGRSWNKKDAFGI